MSEESHRVEKIICVKRQGEGEYEGEERWMFRHVDVSDLFIYVLSDGWYTRMYATYLSDFWGPTLKAVEEDLRHVIEIHLETLYIIGTADEEGLKEFLANKMSDGSKFCSVQRQEGSKLASYAYMELQAITLHDAHV